MSSNEDKLAQLIMSCSKDPVRFARVAYEWGKDNLANSFGLKKWQETVMGDIRDHLNNPETRFKPLRIAVASGHGVGKSCIVSMICDWALSTCVDTKIVLTANTSGQLETKTMPEVNKWFRLSINAHWFRPTAQSVAVVDPEHARTWRLDALTWSENNTEAFAGLHNEGKRIVLVFDEASAIADKVWEVAEGAMTDTNTEIIWLVFGNPTQNTGRFRECFGKFKHRWKTYQIDSRTVEGTNKEEIQQWVEDYGEDSDFVRVRVKGEFPRAGTMQFIPSDIVEAARKREAEFTIQDPLIMGVDVARFGDDSSVILFRRGRDAKSIKSIRLNGVDTMTLAARVVELAQQHNPDAIFVDGGGVGGGVVDRLRMFRLPIIDVNFGAAADKSIVQESGALIYANKRAEMWGSMRDWLKVGAIEDSPDLAAELTAVRYGYTMKDGRDAIILEKKSDMKKRGVGSPDIGDALCLSFAYAVMPMNYNNVHSNGTMHKSKYDPFSPLRKK